jgi:hypothetical protein
MWRETKRERGAGLPPPSGVEYKKADSSSTAAKTPIKGE